MKFLKTLKKGFTLVELVIVIAVIAVLSAVLIPVFGNVIKSSKVSALKSDLNTCTNTLVMYSLYNEVDYYTPAVVREFLKSEKIDGLTSTSSKYCLDGYSVWYNQKTFNFQLIKNSEISKYIDTSAASASYSNISAYSIGLNRGNTTHYASSGTTESGATSIIDTLPRRPEAITPDRNMLLVATDEANKGVLEGIEKLYCLADSDKSVTTGDDLIERVRLSMSRCGLMNSIKDWTVGNYTDEFNPKTTAWLNNLGQFITEAEFEGKDNKKTAAIKNVIVSPYLGNATTEGSIDNNEISGGIYTFGNRQAQACEGGKLNVTCAIEIATFDYDVELKNGFYGTFVNGTANIVISGKVTANPGTSAGGASTTTVSTVTGGGSNISSAVSAGGGSAIPGGSASGSKYVSQTMTSAEFKDWTTPKAEGGKATIECENFTKTDKGAYKVSVKTPDGKIQNENLTQEEYNAYFENNSAGDTTVDYKYNTSSFSIDLHEFLTSLGIKEDKDIISVEISDSAYRGVYTTSVFMLYKKDGTTYGKTFNFGVGYITNFDHYYRYANTSFDTNSSGENIYPTYYAISGETQSADAGSLTVKLPEYALNLQSYKDENFKIEVYYEYVTNYYLKGASVFGTDYYEYLGTCKSGEAKTVLWQKGGVKKGGCYAFEFGSHERISYASTEIFKDKTPDYFVNTVQIGRIVIKDMNDNILIAKYPQ